jgi:hypothetical protein
MDDDLLKLEGITALDEVRIGSWEERTGVEEMKKKEVEKKKEKKERVRKKKEKERMRKRNKIRRIEKRGGGRGYLSVNVDAPPPEEPTAVRSFWWGKSSRHGRHRSGLASARRYLFLSNCEWDSPSPFFLSTIFPSSSTYKIFLWQGKLWQQTFEMSCDFRQFIDRLGHVLIQQRHANCITKMDAVVVDQVVRVPSKILPDQVIYLHP